VTKQTKKDRVKTNDSQRQINFGLPVLIFSPIIFFVVGTVIQFASLIEIDQSMANIALTTASTVSISVISINSALFTLQKETVWGITFKNFNNLRNKNRWQYLGVLICAVIVTAVLIIIYFFECYAIVCIGSLHLLLLCGWFSFQEIRITIKKESTLWKIIKNAYRNQKNFADDIKRDFETVLFNRLTNDRIEKTLKNLQAENVDTAQVFNHLLEVQAAKIFEIKTKSAKNRELFYSEYTKSNTLSIVDIFDATLSNISVIICSDTWDKYLTLDNSHHNDLAICIFAIKENALDINMDDKIAKVLTGVPNYRTLSSFANFMSKIQQADSDKRQFLFRLYTCIFFTSLCGGGVVDKEWFAKMLCLYFDLYKYEIWEFKNTAEVFVITSWYMSYLARGKDPVPNQLSDIGKKYLGLLNLDDILPCNFKTIFTTSLDCFQIDSISISTLLQVFETIGSWVPIVYNKESYGGLIKDEPNLESLLRFYFELLFCGVKYSLRRQPIDCNQLFGNLEQNVQIMIAKHIRDNYLDEKKEFFVHLLSLEQLDLYLDKEQIAIDQDLFVGLIDFANTKIRESILQTNDDKTKQKDEYD